LNLNSRVWLVEGNYQLITVLPDGSLVLMSEVLALELRVQADSLRFYTSDGEKLLSHQESEQAGWKLNRQGGS